MLEQLTGREKQILRLVRDNLTNKEIGNKLDLNPYTVANHCKKFCRKLGAKDRHEAVYIANKNGLLD